jgi:hypothetical protein
MMSSVSKNVLYLVGRALTLLVRLAMFGVLLTEEGTSSSRWELWELIAVFILASAAGVVAHELGHLLACLAVGAEVRAFRVGDDRVAIRFRVRSVPVSLGWPYQGQVKYVGAFSVGRRALITLAGSLTQLVLGSVAFAFSGFGARPLAVIAGLGLGLPGVANLMPFRTRSGRLSDGARLFELRSDVRAAVQAKVSAAQADVSAAQALEARKTAVRLLQAGRAAELLELHAGLDVPERPTSSVQAIRLAMVEYCVALLAGLPGADASLAERRVSLFLRDNYPGQVRSIAALTLALLRLRAGGPRNQAEAERLCDEALAMTELPDSMRAVALTVITVSRQARGLSCEGARKIAAATLKPANQELEPAAAQLRAILDPEGFLAAFRAGAPYTRLDPGPLALMLRRQGRVSELLELHQGFGVPGGRYASAQARSLHGVEYNLLLVPGLPREVVDEAASRVRSILGNYPFETAGDQVLRPAMEHTLALALLRQGKFEEVEPLCASGLAGDHGPDARATVLATVALARHGLGQPHADLLAEAVALSPDADLVAEAAEVHRERTKEVPNGRVASPASPVHSSPTDG